MKSFIKKIFYYLGYEITKLKGFSNFTSPNKRPVGRMDTILEDLKIRGLNCKSILDVGANSTNWSRLANNIFPNAHFYLIEPQIEMEKYLKSFTDEFVHSVYFLNGAGAKNEVLTLTVWDDLLGTSLLPHENDTLLKNGKQRKIEIIKIDDLIESHKINIPELIKLDIQGFELEALKGAEKTFGYTEVYILEVSLFPFADVPGIPVIADVINFMLQRDYVIYDFAGFFKKTLGWSNRAV
jgi:FkbM family methyltransferase